MDDKAQQIVEWLKIVAYNLCENISTVIGSESSIVPIVGHNMDKAQQILPIDIIIEIICWLDPKSLVKLQLVCKEWQSIIYSPDFAHKYDNSSAVGVYYINATPPYSSDTTPARESIKRVVRGYSKLGLRITKGESKFGLLNSNIKQYLELPDSHPGTFAFSPTYLSATRSHKILSFYQDKDSGSQGCEVFDSDYPDKWRRLESYPVTPQRTDGKESSANELRFYSTGEEVHCVGNLNEDMVTVDMRTESSKLTSWPPKFVDVIGCEFVDWCGHLGLYRIIEENLHVNVFGERKKYVWGDKKIIPLPFVKKKNYDPASLELWFVKDSDLWFWLVDQKVFIYNMETGLITDKGTVPSADRDCHDTHGAKDMCVAGAIQNFTNQLSHYQHGTSESLIVDVKLINNMTEALLFLSHFMGDIHEPMHVGFTTDEGGNSIDLRWFRHKSNLHHVWDREIILTAAADYYDKDMSLLQQDIARNSTHGTWSDDLATWRDCTVIANCVNKYAAESINIACKWGYKDVESGDTLSDDYFNTRYPIVMKRIAQGGVRLAMILNRVLGDIQEEPIRQYQ